MDFRLAEVAQISWSDELRVTRAVGACERVLRDSTERLLGRPLHEVLGIPPSKAKDLDDVARREAPSVEFLRCQRGEEHTWLRLALGRSEAGPSAAILDLEAVLAGAPPLQISPLSSSLSHEIRNPLSSVKMAVQTLARNEGLSERDQRRLVIANREVRTMERMLWLLSEYGRDTPPRTEPIGLRALVQEAAAMVEPELSERKIQVRVLAEEDAATARISADPTRLRPVLAQLLLNVAMGQPEGSSVDVKLEPSEGGCRLILQDPSANLPAEAEERARIFEPFRSMLARGAGLSLAALHRVLTGHGGSVTAEGGAPGTVYTLSFPA